MNKRMLRSMALLSGPMRLRSMVRLSGQRIVFPFWHTVSDTELPHIKHLYSYPDEDHFESGLDQLLKVFTPIGVEEYMEVIEGKRPAGSRPAMLLSFDDGLFQCYSVIAPMLKRKGIPALFFLNNDFIDNRELFYRYKASILVEFLSGQRKMLIEAADYLAIPDYQVKEAILMVSYRQKALLDALALHLGIDWAIYMRDCPVYMSSDQVRHLLNLGFHVGAHSTDHPEFFRMESRQVEAAVDTSMKRIIRDFRSSPACFAFPFTSDGIPSNVIDGLLEDGVADLLFGTAGLKRTGRKAFIQRVPMEVPDPDAWKVIKAEYLYYFLKGLLGRNSYFRR